MKPANRQRVIGLGLLVLLLTILVPWATHVPDDLQHQLNAKVPEPPQIDWLTLQSPIDQSEHAQVAADIATQRQQALKQNGDKNAKPAALRAYALKLQQYDDLDAARQMQQALQDAGYTAYIRQNAEQQFVLYAGPELERKRLQALKKRLLADQHFTFKQPQVVAYQP